MERYFQVVAAVLLAVVLGLVLSREARETGVLLSLAVCCMAACAACTFLEPVFSFLHQLREVGQLDSEWIGILGKAVGIGLLSQLAGLICADAGNASLGRAIGILSAAAMLWLSVPLLQGLLELVERILGEV